MGFQRSFEVLSTIIDDYEREGWPVHGVETDCPGDRGTLRATIAVTVPRCPSGGDATTSRLDPSQASLTAGGHLTVEFPLEDRPTVADRPAVTRTSSAATVDDGDVRLEETLVIESAGAAGAGQQTGGVTASRPSLGASGPADPTGHRPADAEAEAAAAERVRDESIPAYEDHAYLEHLYETNDTFAAMSAAIDMDVSTETVRRYMIDAGVHDPTTYESETATETPPEIANGPAGASVDGESGQARSGPRETGITEDQLRTDGVGLPENLALTEVVEAIANARSIYEVSQALGVDQDRTRSLLEHLDCLDFVSYRLTEVPDRSPSYDTVARRIRECDPDRA